MEDINKICENCRKKLFDEFKFCPYCGQKTDDSLTLGVLFYNTVSNYFSFDARFFKSFFPLMFRPGYLASKFVGGKRLQFLHPAQYYLFVSVIFFFIFSFQTREYNKKFDNILKKGFESTSTNSKDSISNSTLDSINITKITKPLRDNQLITKMEEEQLHNIDSILNENVGDKEDFEMNFGFDRNKLDSLISINAPVNDQLKALGMKNDASFMVRRFYTQMLKFQKNNGGGILQGFFDSIPIALFILLPIFAFLLKLFYWKRGHYSHHLVFSFYYFSFMFMVLSLIMLANLIWKIPNWLDGLVFISTYLYLFLAIKHFYKQGFILSFFKTGFITSIYIMMVIPIAIILMSITSFLIY